MLDFSKVTQLVTDFQAGKYTDAARDAAGFVVDCADFIDQLHIGSMFAAPGFEAQIDAHRVALQGCCDHPPVAAGGEAGLNPGDLTALIQSVISILNIIRNWRKPVTP